MDATLLTALILLAIGAAAFLWIFAVIFRSFFPSFRSIPSRLKTNRSARQLAKADAFLEQGNFDAAASVLRNSFILEHITSNGAEIEGATDQHLSILNRIVSIADKRGIHLRGLAVMEELVQTRGQLQHEFLKTSAEMRSLKNRRREEGKETPEWAVSEFQRRLDLLSDRIITNRRTLLQQFDELLLELKATSSRTGAQVH